MGEKLSIKIKLADREYPMKVEAEEEARLRKAGKLVNERLKYYKNQFGISDFQDLLAMVAFDSLVERLKKEENLDEVNHTFQEKVSYIDELITSHLSS